MSKIELAYHARESQILRSTRESNIFTCITPDDLHGPRISDDSGPRDIAMIDAKRRR